MKIKKAELKTAKRSKLFHLSYEGRKSLYGYCFILPWIIGFIVFFLSPFITSIIYSFNDITFVQNGMELSWNNFRVYRQFILEDPDLLQDLVGVFTELLYQVPIIVVISVMIAVLLNDKYRGKTFFRAVFFLPVILSGGAALTIIRGDSMSSVMLEGAKMGGSMLEISDVQSIIRELQLPTELSDFLIKTANQMFNLLWKSGLQILIFLAAIQTISPSIYEASKIEGASAWDNFWKITMPMISPMIILSVIYSIIDSFTNATNVIMNQMVSDAQYLKYTHASVLAVLYFTMAMIFIGIVFVVLNKVLPDTSTRR